MLQEIMDAYPDLTFLKADGFDDCVIGVDMVSSSPRLIYSVTKVINKLVDSDGMTYEEAIEHYEYNIAGSHVGEQTPIWCSDDFH